MTTTTDDDLRDLLWHAGLSPAEIEAHLANEYARVFAKMFLDKLHERVVQKLAEGLMEELFPEGVNNVRISQG